MINVHLSHFCAYNSQPKGRMPFRPCHRTEWGARLAGNSALRSYHACLMRKCLPLNE